MVVRFCTMDGSPQHGYDWLLHGSITISVREGVRLFYLANEYLVQCLQQGDDRRALELRFILLSMLHKVLNLPVAFGSGKAGIRNKLHALVHSERLFSWSWAATATRVSSSFCLMRDLGCESSILHCRIRLRDLFPLATDTSDVKPEPLEPRQDSHQEP